MSPDSVNPAAPPLICTGDDLLLEVLLDWCSAVGVVPEVAPDAGLVRRSWSGAPFILVGDDLAADVAHALPRRRPGVLVVARPGRELPWDAGVSLGAEDVLAASDRDAALTALTAAVDGKGDACVVAVVGGAGGAGASCFAGALALEAGRRDLRVLLVDGDPWGGGVDVLLGLERDDGLRWPAAGQSRHAVSARSLTEALPRTGNVWVLAPDRSARPEMLAPVGGLLAAARRGFDVVVCDVARHPDERSSDLLAQALLTVVVVPEDVRALAASTRLVGRLQEQTSAVAAVTARRRPGLDRDTIASALGLPVLARVRFDRRLGEAIDHGLGPGHSTALRRAARPVLDLIGAA